MAEVVDFSRLSVLLVAENGNLSAGRQRSGAVQPADDRQ